MVWKSRRDAEADLRWPRIAGRVVPGVVVVGALLSGAGRRVITGLYRRHIQGLAAGIGLESLRASIAAMTWASAPAVDEAASAPGSPLDADSLSEPLPPLSTTTPNPTDRLAILKGQRHEQPHEQPHDRAADDDGTGSDRADSVIADGSTTCPAEFPIKGNGRSGIYHLPGAFAYARTVPSICFRTAGAAERAGFRAARAAGSSRP
ncbi:MAG: hypothetical protein H0W23_02285 [Chloroflexia bacterium]|nr:hypothetical protein [Chloroflexia bacterium]